MNKRIKQLMKDLNVSEEVARSGLANARRLKRRQRVRRLKSLGGWSAIVGGYVAVVCLATACATMTQELVRAQYKH